MNAEMKSKLMNGAIKTGVINAIINVVIQYFLLKGHETIPISVDSITNTTETVLGTSVMLAITLSVILTFIAYFGIKEKKTPLFPTTLWLAVKHAFFTFGVLTSLSVLWQKYMGTLDVSIVVGIVIIAVIAGLVSGFVNYFTLKESIIFEEQQI